MQPSTHTSGGVLCACVCVLEEVGDMESKWFMIRASMQTWLPGTVAWRPLMPAVLASTRPAGGHQWWWKCLRCRKRLSGFGFPGELLKQLTGRGGSEGVWLQWFPMQTLGHGRNSEKYFLLASRKFWITVWQLRMTCPCCPASKKKNRVWQRVCVCVFVFD